MIIPPVYYRKETVCIRTLLTLQVVHPSKDGPNLQQECDELRHKVDELTIQITQIGNENKKLLNQTKSLQEAIKQVSSVCK